MTVLFPPYSFCYLQQDQQRILISKGFTFVSKDNIWYSGTNVIVFKRPTEIG